MAKYPYFDAVEGLGTLMLSTVRLACGNSGQGARQRTEELSTMRQRCHKAVCELEDALFSDFLPPLERDDLAAIAHALARVTERASEAALASAGVGELRTTRTARAEADVCLRLAEQLCSDLAILKKIRKPTEMPALHRFRELLASSPPSSRIERSSGARIGELHEKRGRLLSELAAAYDTLIEVMLNNI